MSQEPALEKRELRQRVRAGLTSLTAACGRDASVEACALLRQQPVWQNARTVLFYLSVQKEIDLSPLLEEGLASGKIVALPRFIAEAKAYDAFQIRALARDCAPGKFGILEPAPSCARFPLKRLDLALAPGIAFDATGHRLGRGQGFYDRLLAQINGIKCGVAFDCQIVERIPAEPHDVHMNYILTPTRWLKIPA